MKKATDFAIKHHIIVVLKEDYHRDCFDFASWYPNVLRLSPRYGGNSATIFVRKGWNNDRR